MWKTESLVGIQVAIEFPSCGGLKIQRNDTKFPVWWYGKLGCSEVGEVLGTTRHVNNEHTPEI